MVCGGVCVYRSMCAQIHYVCIHTDIQIGSYRYIYLKKGSNKNTKLCLHCGIRMSVKREGEVLISFKCMILAELLPDLSVTPLQQTDFL